MPVSENFISSGPRKCFKLPAAILRWMENSIQAFGFMFVQNRLPLSLLDAFGNRLWKLADLPGQLDER
jgi:hypothetical protein